MTASAEPPADNLQVTGNFRKSSRYSAFSRWLFKRRHWLLCLLGLALARHALAGVAWQEVRHLLAGIGLFALLIIGAVNLLLLPLMSARWWLLLKLLDSRVNLSSVCAYRLAANAVSYLTPGPHFGGEPLSVYLLHRRHEITLSTATLSVAMDRLLELAASFVVLALCLPGFIFGQSGLVMEGWGLGFAITVPALFFCILTALFMGKNPLTRTAVLFRRFYLGRFSSGPDTPWPFLDIIHQGETMAERLFREQRLRFLLANLFSLGHWLGVFVEFWLMAYFLGFPLSFSHLLAVVMVARLAFYTPLPAGIGVLESALPWLTDSLGLGSGLGLGFCLIIRSRDLLFSLTGLGLTMKYLTCRGKAGIIKDHSEKYGTNDLLK